MNFLEVFAEKWNMIYGKIAPVLGTIGGFFHRAWEIILKIVGFVLKFRKIFLAAPVVYAAIKLAKQNLDRLPEVVGLDVQLDGTYAMYLSREQAAWGPVLITTLCLLMMFCSRRVLTPWLVSVMTLAIPVFIWVINVFPS